MHTNRRILIAAIIAAGLLASFASVALSLGEGFAGAGISTSLPAYVRVQSGASTTTATVDATSLAVRATLYGAGSTNTPAVAQITANDTQTVYALAVGSMTRLLGDATGGGGIGTWDRWSAMRQVPNTTSNASTAVGLGAVAPYAEYLSTPPTLTNGTIGRLQMNAGGSLIVTQPAATSWSVSADTELPAAAALSDAFANPTAPAAGAFSMLWTGAAWVRGLGDATNGAYVQLKGNSITAPAQVSESYDSSSSRTVNTATSTTAGAVPASALAARRLVRLYNTDASINMYVCLNNASCANSAGANFGILLPPGGQRDYPIGPTNVLYVVAASGTPTAITEELK